MVLVLLKETVINCSVGYIGDPRGTLLAIGVLAPSFRSASKTDFRNIQLCVLSLHLLDKGGLQFNSSGKVITQSQARHDIQFSGLDAFQQMADLGRIINSCVFIIFQTI
jgi:hypothetical protein